MFTGTTYHADADGGGVPRFGYHKADRRVTAYYFYLVDEVFGPAFIKVCAYFPYPIKIWLNGHEYAKRAATAAGIGFTELDNGFATTEDPAGLQRLCDGLGAGPIRVFCERWWARLPLPLTDADRAGGLLVGHRDAPGRGLAHHRVRPRRGTPGGSSRRCAPTTWTSAVRSRCRSCSVAGSAPHPRTATAPGCCAAGDEVTLNAHFRHSRVKSYLKCGRAFRIETVVNDTGDLGVARGLEHLAEIFGQSP